MASHLEGTSPSEGPRGEIIEGLISVVVPVFNRPDLLRESLASLSVQTYPHWELIVVDDGSTDDTPAVIDGFRHEHLAKTRPLRQENKGPGAAREAGCREARGEYLHFLDSDDLLLPRSLELFVEGFRRRAEAGVAYGVCRIRGLEGQVIEPAFRSGQVFDELFPALLSGRIWTTGGGCFRRDVCERAGGWSDLRLDEDWEFEARVAALCAKLSHVEEVVVVHRNHTNARAGLGHVLDRERLRQQAAAHLSILASAHRAGVERNGAEMVRFAKALFLLSRKCGAAGLARESRDLHRACRSASGSPPRFSGLFGAAATVLGWRKAGRLFWAAERAPLRRATDRSGGSAKRAMKPAADAAEAAEEWKMSLGRRDG